MPGRLAKLPELSRRSNGPLARHAGMTGAYALRMMDFLTGDAALAIFTTVGIVATAVSIVRDAKEQKSRLVTVSEEVPIDLGRVA